MTTVTPTLQEAARGLRAADDFKRAFDIGASAAGIVLLLPVFVLLAVLVRLDSPGPVFFRQQRPGRNMRAFTMIKFRTMVDGAHKMQIGDFAAAGYGPQRKGVVDPRITKIGRFLRHTSLDELPQLFNVLRGEMSIVGPRPLLGWELAEDGMIARSAVQPGITGLWQVMGRSDLTFDDMLKLDLAYIERRSLLLDLGLVLRTIPAVLFGRGAY
jgi:lipopolysaccharide/colanic/teichoic acid biosynthesis glycosyltransferase